MIGLRWPRGSDAASARRSWREGCAMDSPHLWSCDADCNLGPTQPRRNRDVKAKVLSQLRSLHQIMDRHAHTSPKSVSDADPYLQSCPGLLSRGVGRFDSGTHRHLVWGERRTCLSKWGCTGYWAWLGAQALGRGSKLRRAAELEFALKK
eukprot:2716938-Amphidinium_carterae.1